MFISCTTTQTLANDAATNYFANGGVSQATIQAAARARTGVASSLTPLQSVVAAATALMPSIPARRLQFYQSHTMLHTRLALFSTQAILSLCDAIGNISSGNLAGALTAASASQASIDDLFAAQRLAEYGTQWHGMYMYDKLSNYGRARQLVHQLVIALQTTGKVHVPVMPSSYYECELFKVLNLHIFFFLPTVISSCWCTIFAQRTILPSTPSPLPCNRTYCHTYFPRPCIAHYFSHAHLPHSAVYNYQLSYAQNFPFLHFNASWNMYRYVRINCQTANLATGDCVNTAEGGHFRGATAPVTMAVLQVRANLLFMSSTAPLMMAVRGQVVLDLYSQSSFHTQCVCTRERYAEYQNFMSAIDRI